MWGIDGELIRWAATGIATVGGWLIGRHDKLRAAKRQREDAEKQAAEQRAEEAARAEEQRKREQAAARQATKALAEAVASKNAELAGKETEILYLRGMVDRLLGERSRSSLDSGAHG